MDDRRHRVLTAAEEVQLSRRIERGDVQAKETMIQSNLGLVHSIARRYHRLDIPYEDLAQEGTVGLIRAVERFDHRRGAKFSTYASWWIRRAITDALDDARTIRMPAHARRQLAAVRRAETELRGLAAGAATSEAIAERTGLSAGSVRTLRGAARVTASLDENLGEDGTPLSDLVPDPNPVDPWSRLEGQETRSHVWWMLKLLPKRHREILVLRYGIHGDGAQTHAQIAARLGIGEERSRQLEREALHRLRELGGGQERAA
jgi:RNA polymerase primary sigma factor